MLEAGAVRDRRVDLVEDLERPQQIEELSYRSLDGDRRLPLWYASGMSEAPPDIAERLSRFMELSGKDPAQFELRHNWWMKTIDFVRWIPEFEDQDGTTALVVRSPQDLHSWPDAIGWLPGGDFMLDLLWSGFIGNRDDERDAVKKREREVLEMELVVNRYAQAVAGAMATPAEIEAYEYARNELSALTGAADDSHGRELAEEVRPLFKQLGKELGI